MTGVMVPHFPPSSNHLFYATCALQEPPIKWTPVRGNLSLCSLGNFCLPPQGSQSPFKAQSGTGQAGQTAAFPEVPEAQRDLACHSPQLGLQILDPAGSIFTASS